MDVVHAGSNPACAECFAQWKETWVYLHCCMFIFVLIVCSLRISTHQRTQLWYVTITIKTTWQLDITGSNHKCSEQEWAVREWIEWFRTKIDFYWLLCFTEFTLWTNIYPTYLAFTFLLLIILGVRWSCKQWGQKCQLLSLIEAIYFWWPIADLRKITWKTGQWKNHWVKKWKAPAEHESKLQHCVTLVRRHFSTGI